MKELKSPRIIDSEAAFEALVSWLHDEVIVRQRAPGFLIGLSGTDSIVTFLAASKAFEKAGKPGRVLGVHFAPSDDFLYDHPESETHLWFSDLVIPWLKEQAPGAEIIVDTSIDWRCDGLRWGYLMDLSIVSNGKRRMIRLPEEQYWVVGTRNRTEDVLLNYSNVSMAVSLQPLIHLWKSEVLQISKHLGVPDIAIDKSCETDCICGREALAANHIKEVDALLQARNDCSTWESAFTNELYVRLDKFIEAQIAKNGFKKTLPYTPDPYVFDFESGSLNLKKFNHFGHLYIAFHYIKNYGLATGLFRYGKYLKDLLDSAGASHKFNLEVTTKYFLHLDKIMKEYPDYNDFGKLAEAVPSVMEKISA